MKTLFLKEISNFFSSYIGAISIIVFLAISGLVLWVFPEYSLLNYGYATLDSFFSLAPILLLFIIPAITMSLFSQEVQSGTLEWLLTKPLSTYNIVLAKYFASVVLILISLIPTFIYYYSVYQLGYPVGNIDIGGTIGSYIGLFFLAATFCAIGIFCSSLSSNQIVAFILSALFCAIMYWGFDLLASFDSMEGFISLIVKNLGISYHYDSISRGIIDTRDIIYFISVIFLFLFFTNQQISKER